MANKTTTAVATVNEMKTRNLIALVAVVSLFIVAGSIFIGKSLVAKIGHNNRVIVKKEAAQKKLAANKEAIPKLVENFKNHQPMAQLVADALPARPDVPGFATAMYQVLKISGVKGAISPSALTSDQVSTGAPVPTAISYSVSVSGNYDLVLRYFTNLQLSSRPIKLKDINFAGTTSAMSATASFDTYYQPKADLTEKTEEVQ